MSRSCNASTHNTGLGTARKRHINGHSRFDIFNESPPISQGFIVESVQLELIFIYICIITHYWSKIFVKNRTSIFVDDNTTNNNNNNNSSSNNNGLNGTLYKHNNNIMYSLCG